MSPEKAAALVGQSLTLDNVVTVCRQGVSDNDFLLVEGAGGFYSPLASGVLNADLAVALSLPVLLIVPDRLGAINQALLAVEAIKNRGLTLAAVILNEVSHHIDPQWITRQNSPVGWVSLCSLPDTARLIMLNMLGCYLAQ